MTQSSMHADAFFREAVEAGSVWTIRDAGGFPAPANSSGQRVQPFWSRRTRAEHVIATVDAYANFELQEVGLTAFRARWLPGLERDGILVGLNWSGPRATGYDLTSRDVQRNFEARGPRPIDVRTDRRQE